MEIIGLLAIPNEDETFLERAALKYVKPAVWIKERYK